MAAIVCVTRPLAIVPVSRGVSRGVMPPGEVLCVCMGCVGGLGIISSGEGWAVLRMVCASGGRE
jgi:hypothetical protein